MAPTFGRSISFPLSPARSSSSKSSKHVRSTSLPSCRAPHPLLAHLHTQASAARAWSSTSATAAPSTGLARIAALHAALADLLRLPEPQAAVRASASDDDRLLHAFLLLADAHQAFQEALLALRSGAADARAAIRRRDAAALATAARSRRRTEKDLARIAADVARCARLGSGGAAAGEETEMAAALADAAAASAATSAAVFSAVASMSAAAASSSSSKKTATFAAAFSKKAAPETADVATTEKLEELERCIDECESGTEMVFRSIVQTRVTLLNICTPEI
ncbi:hypothetical protein BS78_10G261200 [Paspalum vaginatum]|nr:hypothetical protein BS78_10G261200 [Paspalum vaginatum]